MADKKININLLDLAEIILKDKRGMIITCIIGAVIGVVVAFSIPKKYKCTVMLAPEESSSGFSGSLSSIASMVGMNIKTGMSGDAIYPEIYPDLMGSADFLVSLFSVPVTTEDKELSTSYYEYLRHHQKTEWWLLPVIYLSETISPTTDGGKGHKVNPYHLTKTEYEVMKGIAGNVECDVDKKTSVITISVTDQDKVIAATMADTVKQRLQQFITEYRTKKARTDLAFMEKLYVEAHDQYVKARQAYASFSDANQDVMLQSLRSKQDDLENEMQLKYNIYTQVVEQMQLAKAKVQERTPAFTVVQSASVPVKHSNRPKVVTLAIWVFLAVMVRIMMLLWKNRKSFVKTVADAQ